MKSDSLNIFKYVYLNYILTWLVKERFIDIQLLGPVAEGKLLSGGLLSVMGRLCGGGPWPGLSTAS